MYQKSKRMKALVVSAVMAASSLSFSSVANLIADATGDIPTAYYSSSSSIGAALETADPDPDDPDTPFNMSACTFICKDGTDEWTHHTNTTCGPTDFLGSDSFTTLQFHLKLDDEYYDNYVVSQLTYYFGCSADESCPYSAYWWDTGADYYDTLREAGSPGSEENSIECHPYSNEFDLVIEIPTSALADWTNKFQFQNCYTQIVNTEDKTTKVEEVDIVLVSITAGGTINTSEADDETKAEYNAETVSADQNTGGLWYSSLLYTEYGSDNDYASATASSDGTTLTTLNSLSISIDDGTLDEYTLTQGDAYSEDVYLESGDYLNEEEIRAAGNPLNSHKFYYSDFGVTDANVSSATIKSISVTFKVDDSNVSNITRFMYGGGLNVEGHSAADTEYSLVQAGLKDSGDYWYNSVGSDVYTQVLAYEEETGESVFSIEVEGGTDLVDQNMGTYFTVTWDVPEEVQPYASMSAGNAISFQLWYMEGTNSSGEKVDVSSVTIQKATITYEETATISATDTASVTNKSGTIGSSAVSIPYSEFNMDYEKIADIYAVQATITTNIPVTSLQFGLGTSMIESYGTGDYWYQWDDEYNGTLTLLNWTETTKDTDARTSSSGYTTAETRSTYTMTWLVNSSIQKEISTEGDEDNLQLAVYYADDGNSNVASSYTLDEVTVYYVADDASNKYKAALYEGTLEASPTEMTIVEGTSKQAALDDEGNVLTNEDGTVIVGDDAIIYLTVTSGCTVKSSNKSSISAELNDDGNVVLTAKDGSAGTSSTITITSSGGQVVTVEVTVAEGVEVDTTDATDDTTTTATDDDSTTSTTTTTTTTTANTTDDGDSTGTTVALTATLYGDVNLDGEVNMADVVLLSKAAAGLVDLNGVAALNADVLYDGEVNTNDATQLLKFTVQIVTTIGPT